MTLYGKPIYIQGEFDGYDDLVTICDECGNECRKLNEVSRGYEVCDSCFEIHEEKEAEVLTL